MYKDQEELRKSIKFLKWDKGLSYSYIANATGINLFTLYNFVSGNKANLGHKKAQTLNQFIEVQNEL